MSKLALIIPLIILIILFIFCGENPTAGELLNTYDIDSINVQLAWVNVDAHEMDVKVYEYGDRVLISGSFKYYKEIDGTPTPFDQQVDEWVYKSAQKYAENLVEITGSNIFVKTVDTSRNMTLKFYGKLAP